MPRQRTKIRSDNVLPEILELLKREKRIPKAAIEQCMRALAEREGLGYRSQAVGYGLTALKKLGWASNADGAWSITDRGMRDSLTQEDLKRLGRILYP